MSPCLQRLEFLLKCRFDAVGLGGPWDRLSSKFAGDASANPEIILWSMVSRPLDRGVSLCCRIFFFFSRTCCKHFQVLEKLFFLQDDFIPSHLNVSWFGYPISSSWLSVFFFLLSSFCSLLLKTGQRWTFLYLPNLCTSLIGSVGNILEMEQLVQRKRAFDKDICKAWTCFLSF